MDCKICGKPFSLWGRISGDTKDEICRSCEEEGQARLEGLARSIDNAPDADRDPKQWADRFNELSEKYQVSEEHGRPGQVLLVNAILRWISRKEKIGQRDVLVANALTKKYAGLLDEGGIKACQIASKKFAAQEWEAGRPPRAGCRDLLLEAGETCHWEESARLLEERTRRSYVGGSQGVSIRLARGVYYRVGAFAGQAIDTTELTDAGPGTLHITDRRICFTGERAVAVPYKKIISIAAFADGLKIHRTGAKRPTILALNFPELTLPILALATPAVND